jgi:hypothetical protein
VGVPSPLTSPAPASRGWHNRSSRGPCRPKPTPSDDAEPDLDFSDILLTYEFTETLDTIAQKWFLAMLSDLIRRVLTNGRLSEDEFTYFQMVNTSVFGKQKIIMRFAYARQAGVGVPEGEDWIALSCRSGTGEAFTAAMPRDLTL